MLWARGRHTLGDIDWRRRGAEGEGMSAHVTALHHLAHALKKLAVVQQSLQGRKPDQTQARILIMHAGALGDTRKRKIQEKKKDEM